MLDDHVLVRNDSSIVARCLCASVINLHQLVILVVDILIGWLMPREYIAWVCLHVLVGVLHRHELSDRVHFGNRTLPSLLSFRLYCSPYVKQSLHDRHN